MPFTLKFLLRSASCTTNNKNKKCCTKHGSLVNADAKKRQQEDAVDVDNILTRTAPPIDPNDSKRTMQSCRKLDDDLLRITLVVIIYFCSS